MAFDYGSAGGGAITGAQAGSTIAPGIGTAIGAVAGGLLGGFGGGKKGTAPTWQWLQNPEYQNTRGTMESTWDYLGKGLQSLQEGKPPTWWQNYRPLEEYQRKNALYGQYYGKGAGAQGNQWGPGILDTQRAADVAAGRRGAGGGSNYAKQLNQYSQGMTEIDKYLSQLGFQAMGQQEQTLLSGVQGMLSGRGPEGQWSSVGGTAAQPGWGSQVLNAVGGLNATQGGFAGATGLNNIFGSSYQGGGGVNIPGTQYSTYDRNNTPQGFGWSGGKQTMNLM